MSVNSTKVAARGAAVCLFLVLAAAVATPQEAARPPEAAPAGRQAAPAVKLAVPAGKQEAPAGKPAAPGRSEAQAVQATSLLGEPLGIPPLPAEAAAAAQLALEKAQQAYGDQPNDVGRLIALGRRFAGVGKYKEAVALYGVGLKQHPDNPHLLRHRGHRFITLRMFDEAVGDLARAAELVAGQPDEPEPPLVPNARGIVLDTFHENIHYHLALAHYLRGEWEAALAGWEATARCVRNDDGRAMVAHWTWLTLQRLGRAGDAAAAIASISAEMDIVEYHAYHQAVLVYRGELDAEEALAGESPQGETSVEFASLGYGIARWHLAHGRDEQGAELLRRVAGAEMWPAFGRIAAEADLARAAKAEPPADAEPPAR